MSNLYMYWGSQTSGIIQCFDDEEKSQPMDLSGRALMLIAKKKKSNTDAEVIFELTIGSGLTLDNTPDHNQISFIIPAAETTELPRAKDTAIWIELLADPDGEDRQTILLEELLVKASAKEAAE